jgi:hypothetical protein
MAAHYAEFRWDLPPERSTIARFVDALARSAGYPCRWVYSVDSPTVVSAALSFPHVSKNNLVALEGGEGALDFAAVPFIWPHAIAAVRELGGVVVRSSPPVPEQSRAPKWRDLKWLDQVRMVVGLAPWVRPVMMSGNQEG